MNLLINLLSVFFVLVALLMVLVILMQRPKSEGLGAAFGGAVTENIFGAQTTNVLVKFTTWLAGIFFALTFGLSVLYAHRGTGGESAFRRELMKQQAAPATSPLRGDTSGFARFFSSEFANSGVSCFFSGASRATNSDAVRGVSLKQTRRTALQSSIFRRQFGKPPLQEGSRKSSQNCYFFVIRL